MQFFVWMVPWETLLGLHCKVHTDWRMNSPFSIRNSWSNRSSFYRSNLYVVGFCFKSHEHAPPATVLWLISSKLCAKPINFLHHTFCFFGLIKCKNHTFQTHPRAKSPSKIALFYWVFLYSLESPYGLLQRDGPWLLGAIVSIINKVLVELSLSNKIWCPHFCFPFMSKYSPYKKFPHVVVLNKYSFPFLK